MWRGRGIDRTSRADETGERERRPEFESESEGESTLREEAASAVHMLCCCRPLAGSAKKKLDADQGGPCCAMATQTALVAGVWTLWESSLVVRRYALRGISARCSQALFGVSCAG